MPRADIDGFRLPVVLLSALIALAMTATTPAYAFLIFFSLRLGLRRSAKIMIAQEDEPPSHRALTHLHAVHPTDGKDGLRPAL
jgi:hypothetical protein